MRTCSAGEGSLGIARFAQRTTHELAAHPSVQIASLRRSASGPLHIRSCEVCYKATPWSDGIIRFPIQSESRTQNEEQTLNSYLL